MLPLNFEELLEYFTSRYKDDEGKASQAGVVLMIVPVIVIIVGVFVAYMSRSVQLPDFYKEQETQIKMERVMDALSSYVQRFHRLPCPARPDGVGEPFGFEEGSGFNGNNIPGGTCGGLNEGLIPWNTLGLVESDAIDGWGRYMTYAISPSFAINPRIRRVGFVLPFEFNAANRLPRASTLNNQTVHAYCRQDSGAEDWINNITTYRGKNGTNYFLFPFFVPQASALNPWKARFCCAGGITNAQIDETTDLRISINGGPLSQTRTGNAFFYRRADISVGNPPLPIGGNIEVPVVTLVSHGANASGAFLVNGTNNRIATPAASFGAAERENADGDRVFFKNPRTLGDNAANYFDDIVMFRTQNTLYKQLGTLDCRTPY